MSYPFVAMEEIGTWGSGGTPTSGQRDNYGGNIPWLIIEDLNDGIVTTSKATITELGLRNSSAKLVEAGTLLVAMYGSIGKLGITGVECATNQAIAFCRCNPEYVVTKYLFYFLMFYRPNLVETGRGGTQQNINQEILKSLRVPLPPLDEQHQIVAQLDKADRIRRMRRYAQSLSDTFLQSVFLEIFGDPVANPKGWDVKPLGEMLAIEPQIGTIQPAMAHGAQRCVRVGELGGANVNLNACAYTTLTGKELERFLLLPGDVLLARAIGSQDHLGKMSILQAVPMPTVFDSHVMRLRLDDKQLSNVFLQQILLTPSGRSLFLSKARRTAVQFNINAEQIKEILLPTPKRSMQEQFVQLFRRQQRLLAQQGEASRQADHLFHSLLQSAFSGG